jgi:hypothetical protein
MIKQSLITTFCGLITALLSASFAINVKFITTGINNCRAMLDSLNLFLWIDNTYSFIGTFRLISFHVSVFNVITVFKILFLVNEAVLLVGHF